MPKRKDPSGPAIQDEHAAALLALGSPAAEGEATKAPEPEGEEPDAVEPARKAARVDDDFALAQDDINNILEPPPLPGAPPIPLIPVDASRSSSSSRATNSRDDKWQDMYEELIRYKDSNGDCLVPGRHGKLGPWVQIQRSQHRLLRDGKPSSLSEDRVSRLESLGFAWQIAKDRDECWADMFKELQSYKDKEGDTNVPSTSREYAKLGSWTKRQRMTYRLHQEGKPSPMKQEWIDKLIGIGFEFEGGRKIPATKDDEENFTARLEELKEFKNKHGHCLVPESYPANESLGKWAAQKRKQHKRVEEGKSSKLTPERIAAMDELGFVWQVWGNRTEKWEEMFEELKAYRDREGSCRVPLRDTDNRKLGMWVDRQKTNHRLLKSGQQSPMTDERIAKLESIGFEWQVTDREYEADSWNKRLEELEEYKKQTGDTLVPRNYDQNKKLGRWVDHQRQQYRNREKKILNYMSDEKLKKLEAAGFVWSPPPQSMDQWTQNFQELEKFSKENGHCLVPYVFSENPGLGTWVETLRTQYWRIKKGRSSRLTEDRIKKLETIGFDWEIPRPDDPMSRQTSRGSWDTRFEELKQYKKKEGHCNVPNNYPENKKLGSYVKKQREDYRLLQSGKHSPMKPERIKKLEDLGFQWQVVDREYYHDSWARRFEELKEFQTKEGHCFVPRQFEENQKLAYWVERQRQDWRNLQKGKPSKMTSERIKTLEEVGFAWSATDKKKLNLKDKTSAATAAVPALTSAAPATTSAAPAVTSAEKGEADKDEVDLDLSISV